MGTTRRSGQGEGVSVITVNHNTVELTSLLLWSLYRVLEADLEEVVVVDNGSSDGSLELLRTLTEAGYCRLLANAENLHHGPALNQALDQVVGLTTRPDRRPAWIWVLDSDCVIARPDALSAAVAAAEETDAAVLGEYEWDRWHQLERFGAHCLLLDSSRVCQPGIARFTDGGDPSLALLQSVMADGLVLAGFPFLADGYVIHRGRGTLAQIAALQDRSNPLYAWARDHHQPHFGGVAGAAGRYRALEARFRDEVPRLTADNLVTALVRR